MSINQIQNMSKKYQATALIDIGIVQKKPIVSPYELVVKMKYFHSSLLQPECYSDRHSDSKFKNKWGESLNPIHESNSSVVIITFISDTSNYAKSCLEEITSIILKEHIEIFNIEYKLQENYLSLLKNEISIIDNKIKNYEKLNTSLNDILLLNSFFQQKNEIAKKINESQNALFLEFKETKLIYPIFITEKKLINPKHLLFIPIYIFMILFITTIFLILIRKIQL